MHRAARAVILAGLAGLGVHAVYHTGGAPASWGLASLCAWGAVLTLRGWSSMDIWEQRLVLWAIFSLGSFAHFVASDPTFQGWASVYYFCGPQYQYCTSTFRWNMRGWRKAASLWNFCLATALAVQRLGVEAGLGGLLPGEEAVTRESFVSIAWRLIPFWLNRWESNFGAECSSILFELPHFALELLVVLPMVQVLAGRLRVVGHPHLRAAPARQGEDEVQRRQEAPALAPDVLRCAWVNDSSQLRLVPRLRAHCRAMTIIVAITAAAATNALVVPLALERQAYTSPRSRALFEYEAELAAVVEAGGRADRAQQARRWAALIGGGSSSGGGSLGGSLGAVAFGLGSFSGDKSGSEGSSGSGGSGSEGAATQEQQQSDDPLAGVPCVAAGNCTFPLAPRLIEAVRQRHAWATARRRAAQAAAAAAAAEEGADGGSTEAYSDTDDADIDEEEEVLLPGAAAAATTALQSEDTSDLLVPTHWAIQLLHDDIAPNSPPLDSDKLSTLLFRAPRDPPATPDLSTLLRNSIDALNLTINSLSLGDALNDALGSLAPRARPRGPSLLVHARNEYLATAAAAAGPGAPPPRAAALIPSLYRNMHKHVGELRRMEDPEHRALVPLVEAALAIMRLSCERWFGLVAVYLGFLLFRDPPPLARAAIRGIARLSRIFQRAILLSFPGVCWVYGAGFLFSTFASVIFWAGPVLRGLEHLRSATAAVAPAAWHDATPDEAERMGGACAICWGDLDAAAGPAPGAEQQQVEGEPPAEGAAGLPCGHAYHRRCLLSWLQTCYGQGRAPTCPMCQAEIAVTVRYRMPTGAAAAAAEAEAAAAEAAGPHRREPGIPGLDVLVDELPDEFRHRFEPPLGPLALEQDEVPAGGGEPVAAEPPPPAVAAAVAAEAAPPPQAERRQPRGPGLLRRMFHRGARPPR